MNKTHIANGHYRLKPTMSEILTSNEVEMHEEIYVTQQISSGIIYTASIDQKTGVPDQSTDNQEFMLTEPFLAWYERFKFMPRLRIGDREKAEIKKHTKNLVLNLYDHGLFNANSYDFFECENEVYGLNHMLDNGAIEDINQFIENVLEGLPEYKNTDHYKKALEYGHEIMKTLQLFQDDIKSEHHQLSFDTSIRNKESVS